MFLNHLSSNIMRRGIRTFSSHLLKLSDLSNGLTSIKFGRSLKYEVISQSYSTKNSEESVRKVIFSKCAPAPVGPYSQAILFDKTVYLSGVLGMDKDNMQLVQGSAGDQARQSLKNMGHILEAAGSCYENVIKISIFLSNIEDFKEVNEVYKEFFCTNPPARSTYQVAKLPMGALVEIEAIAGTGDVRHVS